MNDFTTKLIKTLVEGNNITEVFRSHVQEAVNNLLQIELSEFLNYDKYDRKGFNSGNNRNGSYGRILKTEYGELELKIPRDRNGSFENQTVTPYKRQTDNLESMIIHLYSKGMTTSEIASIMEKMYGHHYSRQTISNISAQVIGDVNAFNNRPLNKRYAVIYLDATFLAVRRDTVTKEALYFALGITPDGYKEILAYGLFPTESAHNWAIMLNDLKSRGLKESLLFITDGLAGIKEVITDVYPKAKHQSCWVHIARNVAHSVRVKDRSEVLFDLKKIYTSDSVNDADRALDSFVNIWKKRYPKVIKKLMNNSSLLTFLSFPKEIRASIYTTNLIENFNKHLKRYTKRKEQFPNEDSLIRFIMSQADNYNEKSQLRIHTGFSLVTAELNNMFN